MRIRPTLLTLVLVLPNVLSAQQAAPVADAFRWETQRSAKNLVAAGLMEPPRAAA